MEESVLGVSPHRHFLPDLEARCIILEDSSCVSVSVILWVFLYKVGCKLFTSRWERFRQLREAFVSSERSVYIIDRCVIYWCVVIGSRGLAPPNMPFSSVIFMHSLMHNATAVYIYIYIYIGHLRFRWKTAWYFANEICFVSPIQKEVTKVELQLICLDQTDREMKREKSLHHEKSLVM